MNDQNDQVTKKLAALGLKLRQPEGVAVSTSRLNPRPRVLDEASSDSPLPKVVERKPAAVFGPYGYFVPVSFVAKDWQVTPRRVRTLLAEGRLVGQCQANGYWEVRYPYIFTMGTRGPALKRNQKPAKGLRLVADNTERRTE
jgi:hypothetical protein